jgi:acetamidase/formamidase
MALHRFAPTHYHTTLGTHAPVLSIQAGDSIITTTVDARGVDHHGDAITPRGNPMTGPFFVDGAEPGDTLAVHLERIIPNRPTGWSRVSVAPNVVDPEFVPTLPTQPDGSAILALWDLDTDAGTATLRTPETSLGRLVLPLEPMLGCFGVAPDSGQAISTATSGPHGGNMDYRGFVAGTTAYFPVAVPGALFFLGDGHARQGDGEIVGTGIETSMEVQVTLRVLKGQTIQWPRGENATHRFTVGNARPLDQCVQHATTEMIRWLTADFGLDPAGAQLLLGQAVEYDLGNIYDPAYTMVCKLAKHWLSRL